jgi:hypothetical protein
VCYTTRVRTPARVAATAVIVSALLGACSSSSPKSSSSKPTAVARVAPRSFAELEARIVAKAPSGFVRQPSTAYDTGPSDLAKAIKDDGEPNAGKLLRAEKFVRGYQRIWIGPEHDQIIVFVYQFQTGAGARQDFARSTRDLTSKRPPGTHKFVVPGLPANRAIGIAGADKNGAAALVFFTTGVFNVQVNCNGTRLEGLQTRALAIAKDQLRRL